MELSLYDVEQAQDTPADIDATQRLDQLSFLSIQERYSKRPLVIRF